MVNITHKSYTLRKAIASATLTVSKQETIDAILNKKVAKGDVYEFSRAAGFLAVKKTSDVIPDCHPLPIEYCAIKHEINGLSILITVEVHTIYKTGVEVEAMHGASVAALTMYDMLKPIDKGVEISNIKLESKKGGKSDFQHHDISALKCAVIVCSDSISSGIGEDKSGKKIVDILASKQIECKHFAIIPDDNDAIQSLTKQLCSEDFNLIFFTGGTGLSSRDITPEALQPLITRDIPGIMEAARNYGQQRMPYAMLSRGLAGLINDTLVISLPGSIGGVEDSMAAIFPQILHVFKVAKGERH